MTEATKTRTANDPPGAGTRVLLGALAGFSATALMTALMWRLHRRLPAGERYPLPPREITERIVEPPSDARARDGAMAAHFVYGAGSGALVTLLCPRPTPTEGGLAGIVVWAGSYLGWVPGFGVLKAASSHPARRNGLMLLAHLAWGGATALTYRELAAARETMLRSGPLRDAAGAGGADSPPSDLV